MKHTWSVMVIYLHAKIQLNIFFFTSAFLYGMLYEATKIRDEQLLSS